MMNTPELPLPLADILTFASSLELDAPEAARNALEERFPADGAEIAAVHQAMRDALAKGTLCDRGADPVRYSRVFKASESTCNFSADAVLMSGPGPRHTHPQGEIDLCFTHEGNPCFDGNPPGWTVYAPGSTHVPTVTDGAMLILYLLPSGAIEFHRES